MHYFPDISVNLSNYPPTPFNVWMLMIYILHWCHAQPPTQEVLAQLAKYVQFGVIAFALAAEYLVVNFHAPIPPDALEWCAAVCAPLHPGVWPPFPPLRIKKNKMALLIGAWFVGNMVQTNLMNTGAFEVYYDGAKVFSKLDSGQAPMTRAIIETVAALRDGTMQ